MNEFKLTAWPELPAVFRAVGYRRMLSDLSQRYLTEYELIRSSGLSRRNTQQLLRFLKDRQLLHTQPCLRPLPALSTPLLARLSRWGKRLSKQVFNAARVRG